jgi:inosine triphosphate pyrophosphatase
MKLYFITGNENKFKEFKHVLSSHEIEQIDLDLAEVQDLNPYKVIEHKLNEAYAITYKTNILVEDTSMYFHCLNGLPGPFIKYFLKSLGNDGLAELVLKYPNHKATAKVIIGFLKDNKEIEFFEGSIEGNIVVPRGDMGFGWDSIFEIEELGKTFAELTFEEKANYSMRRFALEKLNVSLT